MKVSTLAKQFHKHHECDGSSDYKEARAFLIGKGINPNIKNEQGRNLVQVIVHFYEKSTSDLSDAVEWD